MVPAVHRTSLFSLLLLVSNPSSLSPSFGPPAAPLVYVHMRINHHPRLPKPQSFLKDLPALVKPGGVAVLISPYSWLKEYTSPSVRTPAVVAGGGRDSGRIDSLSTSTHGLAVYV